MTDRHVTPTMKAGVDLVAARFVRLDPSNDRTLLMATGGSNIFGVTLQTVETLIGGIFGTLGVHCTAGKTPDVCGNGTYCLLEIGSGGCTPGVFLKADTVGKGIIAAANEPYGARALMTAAEGDLALVEVIVSGTTAVANVDTATLLTVGATLTLADSGKIITVGAAALTATLPAAASSKGMNVEFVIATAAAASTFVVAMTGTDKCKGNGFTAAAGKGATLGTTAEGNWGRFVSDGTDWYIESKYGTWTRVA